MFKVKYDFRRPNWQTFGHVLFVEHEADARAAVEAAEPGAEITSLTVNAASDSEHQRHLALVARQKRWIENTMNGIPNKRGDL